MTHLSFSGQSILVTAGASGIGYAIATSFAAAGGEVHVVDIDADAVARLHRDHPKIYTSTADVSDEKEIDRVFADQDKRFGAIHVLVNCAGIAGPTALIEEIEPSDWRRCVSVNLDATFLCCRQAIPRMRRTAQGCIINISSTAGWHGYPLRTPYASAKWAIIGLTKSIAMELGPAGIRANAICPGSINGARMDHVIVAEAARKGVDAEHVRREYTDGVSLRTFIDANDIADMALFLASPGAAKITGQAMTVDGHIESFGGLNS